METTFSFPAKIYDFPSSVLVLTSRSCTLSCLTAVKIFEAALMSSRAQLSCFLARHSNSFSSSDDLFSDCFCPGRSLDASRSSRPLKVVWHHYTFHYTLWWDFTCDMALGNASSRSLMCLLLSWKIKGINLSVSPYQGLYAWPLQTPHCPPSGGHTESCSMKWLRAACCLVKFPPVLLT